MCLAVNLHEHLVQVPTLVRIVWMFKATFPDLSRKHRTEPVPPETHRLVANIDAALEQDVLDLAQ